MALDYIYVNSKNISGKDWAVVVLPEVFGLNKFIQKTVDDFASQFKVLALALDQMYVGSGVSKVYDYESGWPQIEPVMKKVTGEKFVELFKKTLDETQSRHSEIKKIVVCGFCFGGKLSFLAGVDPRVSKVISFYGGRSHDDFYHGKSVVQVLADERSGDESLAVLAFYGTEDQSISPNDREKTAQLLQDAGISYEAKEFNAGHAYANFERASYNQDASRKSWKIIKDFLGKSQNV